MNALFLTAALPALAAPPAAALSLDPPACAPAILYAGPARWTVVDVDLTDADVPADLVDATTRAMSAGLARQRLLFVLSKEAAARGRVFVVVRGLRSG